MRDFIYLLDSLFSELIKENFRNSVELPVSLHIGRQIRSNRCTDQAAGQYYYVIFFVDELTKSNSVKNKILLFVCIFPFIASGQKVDLDRFNFSSQFRRLPSIQLDSNYRTYNVVVQGTQLMQSYLREMTPEKSVYLEGWKWMNRNGHISFNVKLEDLLPESVSVQERVDIKTDKTGKEISRRIFYCQEVVYTFAATADITDYKGAHIMDMILADRGYKQVYKSPEFPIRQLAEGYFVINALKVTGQLYKNCVNRAMDYLSSTSTDNFGYGVLNVTDFMWILGNRKHPEYMSHRKAFLELKDVLFSLDANSSIVGVRERLKPVINYFESIKKNYTSSSKQDRKLRYASYYNLAKLYYYLDDPQAMMKEASGLILNDFDTSDGKSLEQSAKWLKDLFTQTQTTTRHFPIAIESFKGPYENTVSATKTNQ